MHDSRNVFHLSWYIECRISTIWNGFIQMMGSIDEHLWHFNMCGRFVRKMTNIFFLFHKMKHTSRVRKGNKKPIVSAQYFSIYDHISIFICIKLIDFSAHDIHQYDKVLFIFSIERKKNWWILSVIAIFHMHMSLFWFGIWWTFYWS